MLFCARALNRLRLIPARQPGYAQPSLRGGASPPLPRTPPPNLADCIAARKRGIVAAAAEPMVNARERGHRRANGRLLALHRLWDLGC